MRTTIAFVISLLTITWCGMTFGSERQTLTVGGTGSGMGFMRILGRSYSALHPEITVEVLPSLGTGGGVRGLKAGAIDLAIASRQLTENEKLGVKEYNLGESPFVFAVHPATQIDDVTLKQVINIYNGTISTWRDGSRIRRILRPPQDSDWQLLNSLAPDLTKALEIAQKSEGLYLAVTDTDAIAYLERIRGSFGPSTLTMILAEERKVKILSFNGRLPEINGLGQDAYPLTKSYLLLVRGEASPAVSRFVDYIRSKQGQDILGRVGIFTGNDES